MAWKRTSVGTLTGTPEVPGVTQQTAVCVSKAVASNPAGRLFVFGATARITVVRWMSQNQDGSVNAGTYSTPTPILSSLKSS